MEHNHFVQVAAIAYKFVLLQRHSRKAFLPVYIEFFVGNGYFCRHDIVETLDFGAPRVKVSVFVLDALVILYGIVDYVVETVLRLLNLFFETLDVIIRLESVVLGNTLDFQFGKVSDVVDGDGLLQ